MLAHTAASWPTADRPLAAVQLVQTLASAHNRCYALLWLRLNTAVHAALQPPEFLLVLLLLMQLQVPYC